MRTRSEKKFFLVGILLAGAVIVIFGLAGVYVLVRNAFAPAIPAAIHLPADEGRHENLMEWWYYTGHLEGRDASGKLRQYGFELTFFQTVLNSRLAPRYAAHYAVTDLNRQEFHYDQLIGRPTSTSAKGFDISLGSWRMYGKEGQDHLLAKMDGYDIDLSLSSEKPAVLHGNGGVIDYGLAGNSYYYSRSRMRVQGALTDRGEVINVTGVAWMDHQWGGFIPLGLLRWDWFSVQLDNNVEYMIYALRDAGNMPTTVFGTRIDKNGASEKIAGSDISIDALDTWVSPVTKGVYPADWTISISSTRSIFHVKPLLADQELIAGRSAGVVYWEGATKITGTGEGLPVSGGGYTELTGYASVPLELSNLIRPY
ncbi:MAG TPA: lipocalin-like domain-containing protein [Candidatus Paceibacterota bacterium]|nr:lipocalin-like domain-containing protein [Candidatus Paceibacterota bacterium]